MEGLRGGARARRPPLIAIALLSGAALGLEVLLLRLFAIVQWHHFASMVIGLALLGWGVSGSVLALLGDRARSRFPRLFAASAVGFGVSALAAFAVAQRVPFNPPELLWDWRQPLWLASIYLVLAVPFLCAATGVGAAFVAYRGRTGLIYGADLAGAGAGALAVVAVLHILPEVGALALLAGLGPLAGALVAPATWHKALLVLLATVAAATWPPIHPSPYKSLSRTLQVVGAHVVAERTGPLGHLTAVASPNVPFRDAPGLSPLSPALPPEQRAVFIDGDGPLIVDRVEAGAPPAYLEYLTSALPYALAERPRVLLIGLDGNRSVLQALLLGAAIVDVVEPHARLVRLLAEDLGDFADHVLDDPRVRIHIAEPRAFLAATAGRWDLIALDAGGSTGGLGGAGSDYRLTVEAFAKCLDRLAPGGVLAVTGRVDLPPRSALRLLGTAVAALRGAGIDEARRHLAMVRGWRTVTLVASTLPLSDDAAEAVRRFADRRGFDPVHFPGIRPDEANRHSVLEDAWFFDGATALLGPDAAGFVAASPYAIHPTTDDRPFFHDFFRWRLLPAVLRLRARGGLGLFEWGHIVVTVALAQAIIAAVVLVPLPLVFMARAAVRTHGRSRVRTILYFLALGLAFLPIEIAFIERLVVFFGHPVLAAAFALAAFLLFAGLGSRCSSWLGRPRFAALTAGVLALGYAAALPTLLDALAPVAIAWRGIASIVLIAPLAFVMGMPFPLGLAALDAEVPHWVPWAWAVNGCASVIAAGLAGLIALELGFSAAVLTAAALYFAAAAAVPGGTHARGRSLDRTP
jgi:MFS family permease